MGKHKNRKREYREANQKIEIVEKTPEEEKIDQELKELGLPTNFHSSHGEFVQKEVQAIRIGQIRQYQRFYKKRLNEATIVKMRGTRIHQDRVKLRQDDVIK